MRFAAWVKDKIPEKYEKFERAFGKIICKNKKYTLLACSVPSVDGRFLNCWQLINTIIWDNICRLIEFYFSAKNAGHRRLKN